MSIKAMAEQGARRLHGDEIAQRQWERRTPRQRAVLAYASELIGHKVRNFRELSPVDVEALLAEFMPKDLPDPLRAK